MNQLSLKVWLFIILSSLLVVVGCTSPTTTPISMTETISQLPDIYQSLSITSQPDNQLCWYDASYFVDRWDEFITNPMFEDGLAYGLIPLDSQLIGQATYQVAPNTPSRFTYRGYYHNANDSSATSAVRYVALLNEQQLPKAFDGIDTPYHDMVFNYHETQTFDITVPPLAEGIHEVVLIGIQQVDLRNDGQAGVFFIRVTLIVGNPSPTYDITTYELVVPDEYRTSANADNYRSMTVHTDQSHMIWAYPEIYKSATNQLDFYISTGYMEQANKQAQNNITPQPQPIALITLLDYVQVPIQEDKLVFYGLLSPDNSYSFIPANINVSGESGKKELLVIQINYPRIPYCLLIPPPIEPMGYFFHFRVDVQRYGVDVQN